MNRGKSFTLDSVLCICLAIVAIISSLIGLLHADDGSSMMVNNIYGQPVELYGKGIYAYNSVLTVSSRLGADWVGFIGGVFLFILSLKEEKRLWVKALKTAQVSMFIYFFASLVFGLSMNRLYLLYVLGFGLSVWLTIKLILRFFKEIAVKNTAKEEKHIGLQRCLAISGEATMLIWLGMLIPYFIFENYGELLGVLTTEATFAIDLALIGPGMIICAIWIRKKKDKGYILAPILLYILFTVGPMVILQNVYCFILGIDIPLPTFVGTVLSFIVMGGFAIFYLGNSLSLLEINKSVRID